MKKINNKGFMLAEILAVTVVIMVVFIAIYANLIPTTAEYEARLSYNEVVPQYDIYHLRKIYMNYIKKGYSLTGDYEVLVDAGGCKKITKENDLNYCNRFVNEAGISSVILTKYNLTSLKASYSGEFKDYIDYLPEYKQDNGYDYEIFRIIMKKDDYTYASMPLLANVEPSSNKCFSFDAATGTILDYYDYENNSNSNPICSKDLIIPETINGVQVTKIGENAFKDKGLLTVKIPNSITSIGNQAFYSNELTELVISDSVTTIGISAFEGNKLTTLTLGSRVEKIGNYAFSGDLYGASNQITSVSIPASVTTIGDHAFEYNKLNTVAFTEGLTTIGEKAFAKNAIRELNLPNSLIDVKVEAFLGNQIDSITFGSGLTKISAGVFKDNKLTTLTIPNVVTTIANNAFESNGMTRVTLGSNVTSVGAEAFANNELTIVNLNNKLEAIEEAAFMNNKLTEISIPASVSRLGTHSFYDNALTKVVIYTKTSKDDFDLYGTDIFGWASSYSDSNIEWGK